MAGGVVVPETAASHSGGVKRFVDRALQHLFECCADVLEGIAKVLLSLPFAVGALLLCFGESGGGDHEELSDVDGGFPRLVGVQAEGGGV